MASGVAATAVVPGTALARDWARGPEQPDAATTMATDASRARRMGREPQQLRSIRRRSGIVLRSLPPSLLAAREALTRKAPVTTTRRPTSPSAEEILGLYFPVLDHGFVSLVDYMGTDDCIERAARVSYGYGTRQKSATRGLIRYLRRHHHTTPSEMVELKFHCCMPMFIARQWIRHRTANVNEYSGRYSLIPMLFYTPSEEQLQTQSRKNNQGRSGQTVESELYKESVDRWQQGRDITRATYEWMTAEDIARELARIDLPLSTYTQWYWKIDLHNLLHFLTLRVDRHAQWEIQEYGKVMAGMLKRVAPLSYEAWIDYDVCGAPLSRMELAAIRRLVSPEGDGISARESALDKGALGELGLAAREITELLTKLEPSPLPDFELDVSAAVPAETFAQRFAQAVPNIDKKPSE
jgi:thymidylate synthase (FAD)